MKQKLHLGSERTRPNGSAGRALRPVYSLPWSKRLASTLLPGRIPPMNTKKLKPQIKGWGSLKEWGKFKLYYGFNVILFLTILQPVKFRN